MNKNEKLKEYLMHSNALYEAMKFTYQNDKSNLWRFASYKTFMRKYNSIIANITQLINLEGLVDMYDLDKVPSMGNTIAMQQKEFFDMTMANLSLAISFLNNHLNIKQNEIQNLKNFFESNLRKAVFKEPAKEINIQDVIEQLIIGKGFSKGIDYDRETGRIKVSHKEVVPDFIFHKFDLAVEVKLSKTSTKSKAIVDEINADIRAYNKSFKNLLFIVYDLGTIRDDGEFKNDIDNADNILVSVIKH